MKTFIITFLFFTSICFSQKQYKFDYLIEYELTYYKDSIKIKNRPFRKVDKKIKKYYLTNSKNNDYLTIITEKDNLNYRMIFIDNNGIYSNVIILKSDFNKAEFINLDCKYVNRYQNAYKYQIKNYDFFDLTDTLINDKSFIRYKMSSIKPKKVERKKLGTEFYIIDKFTDFHLPILNFSTAYEEWKNNKTIPNGIFNEKYFIDYYGNLDWIEKIVNHCEIEKKIVIQDECNYAKKTN